MCIIAAKPAGVKMPSWETIRTMWENNRDGAGIMYTRTQTQKRKGRPTTAQVVQIEKGFMTLPALLDRLTELGRELDLTATPVVLHFRITTSGGTKPENCHPFPIAGSLGMLQKLKSTARVGIAHNGIIPIQPRKGISDTMEYILSQLAPLQAALPRFYENVHALELIKNAIGSKMAFLTAEGRIYTVGDFLEDGGIMYSNGSYLPWEERYCYGYGCGGWDLRRGLDYYSIKPRYQALMYLSDVPGAYAIAASGELIEGDDLALNADGTVYVYDGILGAWIEAPKAVPLRGEGLPLSYDPELAYAGEETYTEDEAELLLEAAYAEEEEGPAPA